MKKTVMALLVVLSVLSIASTTLADRGGIVILRSAASGKAQN